jgi:hypothetical protein
MILTPRRSLPSLPLLIGTKTYTWHTSILKTSKWKMGSGKLPPPSRVPFIGPSKMLKRRLRPWGLIEEKRQSKGSRVRRSPSHRPVQLQLASDATSAMVPRAPPVVAPPPVFRPDWETLARLASTPSKLLNLDACPVPTSLRRFYGATDKPKPTWF